MLHGTPSLEWASHTYDPSLEMACWIEYHTAEHVPLQFRLPKLNHHQTAGLLLKGIPPTLNIILQNEDNNFW